MRTAALKGYDQSIASSTTLTDDTGLQFVTVSGAIYTIEIRVVYASPVGIFVPDIRVAVGEDTTARGAFLVTAINASNTGPSTGSPILSNLTGVDSSGSDATDRLLLIRGVHFGNGGTFRLQWAQGTSSSNATIVRAASVMNIERVV